MQGNKDGRAGGSRRLSHARSQHTDVGTISSPGHVLHTPEDGDSVKGGSGLPIIPHSICNSVRK